MKTLLRAYLYSLFTLWIATFLIDSFDIKGGITSYLYTAGILSILTLLVRPILKVIMFPINLITFGVFSWVINVIILYLVVKLTPYVQISSWNFPGLVLNTITISSYNLNLWQTFIVTSLLIGIIVNLLLWLAK